MIPIDTSSQSTLKYCPHPHRQDLFRLLLATIVCVLACASCTEQAPPVVDTEPLGEGLKVIGYAVVGAAVLAVLGKLIK